jgi:hypothetical protein
MAAKEKYFVGKSAGGDLKEAIRHALNQAKAANWDPIHTGWMIKKIAENKLNLGPISVRIRVGGGKGDGGIGPK